MGMMGGGGGEEEEEEFDKVALGLNYVKNPVVARQSILSLKAALRRMSLDEEEIEEVMAKAGLQPEEPQYGVRLYYV